MVKRPMCLLCFLMVLSLGALELMGIPLIRGNPLPLNVQEQIEAHPGSMICGEVEQYENTEFSQSVYLKKTYLIHQSKKFPIENVRIFFKKEQVKVNEENVDYVGLNKGEFFEIYEKVKNGEMNLENLDKETVLRILRMIKEELSINSDKINKKMNSFKISLDNAKMYNKEIELYTKNNIT